MISSNGQHCGVEILEIYELHKYVIYTMNIPTDPVDRDITHTNFLQVGNVPVSCTRIPLLALEYETPRLILSVCVSVHTLRAVLHACGCRTCRAAHSLNVCLQDQVIQICGSIVKG